MKMTQNFDPPSDETRDGPQTSVWCIFSRNFFGSLAAFMKLTRFCLPITQLSQRPVSIDFGPSKTSIVASIFIPLTLMCPSLLCHKLELEALSATTTIFIHLAVMYKVPDFVPHSTTMKNNFMVIICCVSSSKQTWTLKGYDQSYSTS